MVIRFSHQYPKLHNQTLAILYAVVIQDSTAFTPELLEYDTVYYEADGKHYFPLKPGKYMILLFLGNKYIPFTTIRSWDEEKEIYYRSNIGKQFDIGVKQ